jgi:hypothetical protein
MKKSQLQQIIKEEIHKVLNENEDYFQPTHTSNVDWYLVYDSRNKSGVMVPHDPGSKIPKGELLIQKGDKLMKHFNNMYNDEEVNVPYLNVGGKIYFDEIK